MANTISKTRREQLQECRASLGESAFQRIQREIWKAFSPTAPPFTSDGLLTPLALHAIWEDLIVALREDMARQIRDKETASRASLLTGTVWEFLKAGVKWSAVLKARGPGWEVTILRNGYRAYAEQFPSRARADAWADQQCIEISMGWKK